MLSHHHAADHGSLNIVQILQQHGSPIDPRDDDDNTPLHKAAWEGHKSVVKWLLEKGGNATAVNKDGESPLHLASWGGHTKIVEWLLEKGADPYAANKNGDTPLQITVSKKNRLYDQYAHIPLLKLDYANVHRRLGVLECHNII